MGYTPPLRDIRFVLEHIAGLGELATLDDFRHADLDTAMGLLEEAGRFAAEAVAPTNREGDREGARLVDGEVRTPEAFRRVYEQYVAAGWGTVQHPEEFGGGGFPLLVATAVKEMITAANMSFSLLPMLTTGAVVDLLAHGSPEQQATYLPKLVTGEWTATMNLTEPQAGSDVGALTTRAVPVEDGTYRISGQKIFITYGDHDLAENIVHLVLARLPDAPPGTKGISLFLVPKRLVNRDGSLGGRNDVRCVSLEHKLGINASPTCVMAFGEESDGAVGFLVGDPHEGMRQMFTMMNDARLGVGLEGLAIAERAYQQALGFARERRQGRAPALGAAEPSRQSPIIVHPDVRRMLLTMRAYIEAMRCLVYVNAEAIDRAHHDRDPEVRDQRRQLADLLTPITKAWCTDLGFELASLGLQVHGGMGYIEETGAAQHLRDARIASIYEGTNGIQAIDLVTRKLPMGDGAFVRGLIAEIRSTAGSLDDDLKQVGQQLLAGVEALERATEWLLERRDQPDEALAGATPYLRLFGEVLGGWFLARSATAAATTGDEELREAKRATARFYADNLLPSACGLLSAATAGAETLALEL